MSQKHRHLIRKGFQQTVAGTKLGVKRELYLFIHDRKTKKPYEVMKCERHGTTSRWFVDLEHAERKFEEWGNKTVSDGKHRRTGMAGTDTSGE